MSSLGVGHTLRPENPLEQGVYLSREQRHAINAEVDARTAGELTAQGARVGFDDRSEETTEEEAFSELAAFCQDDADLEDAPLVRLDDPFQPLPIIPLPEILVERIVPLSEEPFFAVHSSLGRYAATVPERESVRFNRVAQRSQELCLIVKYLIERKPAFFAGETPVPPAFSRAEALVWIQGRSRREEGSIMGSVATYLSKTVDGGAKVTVRLPDGAVWPLSAFKSGDSKPNAMVKWLAKEFRLERSRGAQEDGKIGVVSAKKNRELVGLRTAPQRQRVYADLAHLPPREAARQAFPRLFRFPQSSEDGPITWLRDVEFPLYALEEKEATREVAQGFREGIDDLGRELRRAGAA